MLMYIFPMKSSKASEMAHFYKNLGVCSNILLKSFQIDAKSLNSRTSLKVGFHRTI